MDINPESVRSGCRHVLVDGWGTDITAQRVDHLKVQLQDVLEKAGYRPRLYTTGTGLETGSSFPDSSLDVQPEAIAYIREDVDFRQEPIIIDDGGSILGGYPVLNISIRDAEGANSDLNRMVLELLKVYGVSAEEAQKNDFAHLQPGTVTYFLRRDTDISDEGDELSKIVDILGSMDLASRLRQPELANKT